MQVKSIKSGSIIVEIAWEVIKTGAAAAGLGIIAVIFKRVAELWRAYQNKKEREFLELSGFNNDFIKFCADKSLSSKDLVKKEVINRYDDQFSKLDPDYLKKARNHVSVNRSSNWMTFEE